MLKVYESFLAEHDLRLTALAATICVLSTLTAVGLLGHARKSHGTQMRHLWTALAAISAGCGVWATHFIALLATARQIPGGYSLPTTLVALCVSIVSFGWAFEFAMANRHRRSAHAAGAVIGLGIAAMHYSGMSGLDVPGAVSWNIGLALASIAGAAILGALALPRALSTSTAEQIAGALILSCAVVTQHFTGMGAMTIAPDASMMPAEPGMAPDLMAALVASVILVILVFSCAGLILDWRERWRAERETDRMRGLADAAVEGLLVCEGTRIVTANASFCKLGGRDVGAIEGEPLSNFLADPDMIDHLMRSANQPIETVLRHPDGTLISVELLLREIDFAGRRHHAIAVRDLRDRKKAEQRIRFLAHNDALTGLPNRAHFNERLDAEIALAASTGATFAVLCLDLDRFKEINDLFGHSAGDEVLQRVAERISAILPAEGLMARLGGDEFTIMLPDTADRTKVRAFAESLLACLALEPAADAFVPAVSSSIGIAFYPADGQDRHNLVNHADTALYSAKSAGRGTYRFFDAEMGAKIHDRRLIEHELRASLANHELRVVYQPQSMVETGVIVGFEALLRWRHPERGEVSPAVFIPIAEETGSILQIGHWVMQTACAEAATWTAQLSIAVNVSAVELHSPNYAESVRDILAATGLPPERLEIEITETSIIRDFNRALTTLRQLKALGIRIAMDDFGTGYSSLSNLRAFPFDKIKIDGSFVREVNRSEDSAAIVRAVLGLGRGLNLPILAEGVETVEELRFLGEEQCQEAQGYLVGRPLPIDAFRFAIHPDEPETVAPTAVAA